MHPDIDYVKVKAKNGTDSYIIAESRLKDVAK
jgi:isoleucyl-tRNA synthetase